MKRGGNPKKRPPPSHTPPARKHRATGNPTPSPTIETLEDEFVDEDVFMDEALVLGEEDEESLILRDMEEREEVSARSSTWSPPPLSPAFLSNSESIS
ncbi:unnamed protein product [Arabis nemorensis]|uniref:Uncharacterized protein n=1 Tax=Arabis nemorensis TaxID=586526 RepID=A0A565CWA8_9BRAS|nr:unnamed protein product [Arabis nemorensis]